MGIIPAFVVWRPERELCLIRVAASTHHKQIRDRC